MFKCDSCKTPQPSHTSPHRIVATKRFVTYTNNGQVSKGWEIVKEENLCDSCYTEQPIQVVH